MKNRNYTLKIASIYFLKIEKKILQ